MSEPEKRLSPTVVAQKGLKVSIPDTAEGREFLEKLKHLLSVEELPFAKVCSSAPERTSNVVESFAANAANAHVKSGSTTYALDLRLEQEGWTP